MFDTLSDRLSTAFKNLRGKGKLTDADIDATAREIRIAKGSGTEVATVSGLVERFFEARKMMSAMASGKGMPGMPGMPGIPGMGGGKKAKQQAKKGKAKRGSGNPAKRAGGCAG